MSAPDRPDDVTPGETFYQQLLDDEVRDVPVALRAASAGHLEQEGIEPYRYFDRVFHDVEVERVWRRTWQMACREEQIPNVGDSYVYEVADISLIVVRTAPDEIRAFHNSCLHRGTTLRTRPGNVQELRCPYHGWTWDTRGNLVAMPSAWDFAEVPAEDLRLPQASVGTWCGFVFVNVDPDAGPLADYLGVLPEHFAEWPLEQRVLAAHVVKVVPCNWKVALEAFIEAYHNVAVHPQLLPTAADSLTEYDIYGPHVSRMVTAVGVASDHLDPSPDDIEIVRAMIGSKDADVVIEHGSDARKVIGGKVRASLQRQTGRDFSDRTDAEVLDGIEYFLFPNFMPWAGWLTPFAYRFRPNGNDPDSSVVDVMKLDPAPVGGERPAAAKTRVLGEDENWSDAPELGVFGRVFNQDGHTFGRVQRGLRASVRQRTVLGRYQESRIRHLHATLDAYIAATPDRGDPPDG